jgi:hypothetical protein
LQVVIARRQLCEEKPPLVIRHHATSRRGGVLEILRHRELDDRFGYGRAGCGIHDLAHDHPCAKAGRRRIGGKDLRGDVNRQGEQDEQPPHG